MTPLFKTKGETIEKNQNSFSNQRLKTQRSEGKVNLSVFSNHVIMGIKRCVL